MSFSIEAVVQNPCLLTPPPLPPSDFLGPEVIKQLYDYRNTFSAWRTYVDECTNDTGIYTAELTSTIISQPTTPESNVTTPSTGNILTNITSTSTKFPVSPQPIKPQTYPLTDDATVIGVVIGLLVLLLVVLIVVIIYKFRPTVWKKICGQSSNRRSPPALYDLDQHAQINYVNNKAERGEYWRGNDPENESHRSSVGDPGGGGERPHAQKVNKVKPINIRTDNNTASYHLQKDITNNVNGRHVTDIHQSPLCKPRSIPDEKYSEKPLQSAQSETIYANHQFEKVMQKNNKGHSNPTFTDDERHKFKALPAPDKLPPIDNRTNDMYIIDESPYDRVDFSASRANVPPPQQSKSKPIPTKRKLKNQKPTYDENAESVDV